MLKRQSIRNYDFKLVIMLIAITVYGIMIIGSAREAVQSRQIMGLAVGLVVCVVLSLIDYSFFLNFYWLIYIANLGLLLLCHFFGRDVNNARRWLEIGGLQFQPSETCKIMLILFFAQFIMKHKDKLNTPRILFSCILLLLPSLYLVESQPDLSTTIVIAMVFCVLLFIGGLSLKIVGGVLAVTVPAAVIFISLILQPDQNIINRYQQTRILAWLYPEKYANAEAYQQTNSITAIGSGQLFGKGYKNNVVGSVKNGNFISEPQTDFIFAIAGEELGFIGCMIIIVLLLLIAIECFVIARRAKDLAGTLICAGMGAIVGFQSFINMGVATGLLPNTGLPLPFVSYGLTSLVSLFIGMGIVLNVGLQPKKY